MEAPDHQSCFSGGFACEFPCQFVLASLFAYPGFRIAAKYENQPSDVQPENETGRDGEQTNIHTDHLYPFWLECEKYLRHLP